MTIEETAAWLEERDEFLILTHLRPDGDTLGSAAGLCQGLRERRKAAFVLPNPETTERYIKYVREYHAPEGYRPRYHITVDTASESMLQINGRVLAGKTDLCIDHHPSNTGYAVGTCLDYGRAACGEIVFDILTKISGTVSKKAALPLYVALSTDTGCFSYGNTNAVTLKIASALVEAGVPNGGINKELFHTKSRGQMLLESRVTSGMEYFHGGAVAVGAVSKEMIRLSGAVEDDMDSLSTIPGRIEGVIIGVTVREIGDGSKISVRSGPGADANAICSLLGGGGHKTAAGCTVSCGSEEAKAKILAAIDSVWRP